MSEIYTKETIQEVLSNAVPEGASLGVVLQGGLMFVADCIHQMDPKTDDTLRLAKNFLESAFKMYQETYNK